MNPICILTDSAAQFPNPVFPGREHVHFFDLPLDIAEKREHENLVVQATPEISIDSRENQKGKNASSQDAFGEILLSLNNTYDEIIILTASRFLNPSFSIIERMVTNFNGGARLFLIDTQTISTGQGFLVEQAARAVHAGVSVAEIERDIRKSIPRIFNILCTPSLFFLHHAGIIDQPQAVVSEFLNLYPIFVLEDGKFTPVNKVRIIMRPSSPFRNSLKNSIISLTSLFFMGVQSLHPKSGS